MKRIISLTFRDMKSITRDLILILSLAAPLLLLSVLRFGVPALQAFLLAKLDFDLRPYFSLFYLFAILLTPMLIGSAAGFLILDEGDENLINYYTITPLGRKGYLQFRLIAPIFISFILSLLVVKLNGLVPLNFISMLPVVLMAAGEAPIIAMLISSLAANKVEGLAISKAAGILYLAPLVAYFAPSPWQYAAGILPPFWVAKIYFTPAFTGLYFIHLILGLAVHLIVFTLLYRRFMRKTK